MLIKADQSAVCTMNRHLHCHAERSEGSVALGSEMLSAAKHDSMATPAASRRCHPERSECAQHDRAVTHTNAGSRCSCASSAPTDTWIICYFASSAPMDA